jgi:hypothetical protein
MRRIPLASASEAAQVRHLRWLAGTPPGTHSGPGPRSSEPGAVLGGLAHGDLGEREPFDHLGRSAT